MSRLHLNSRELGVDVLAYTVHPLWHGAEAERLADALAQEQEAHARSLEQLGEVTRERDAALQLVEDIRKAARVARQQTADTVAASHETAEALASALRERDEARGHLDALRKELLQYDMPAADGPDALESLRQLFAAYRDLLKECRTAKLNAGRQRGRAELAEAYNAQLLQALDAAGHCLSVPEGASAAQEILGKASREPHPGHALSTEVRRLRDAAREVLRAMEGARHLARWGELHVALNGLRAALPVLEGEEVRRG